MTATTMPANAMDATAHRTFSMVTEPSSGSRSFVLALSPRRKPRVWSVAATYCMVVALSVSPCPRRRPGDVLWWLFDSRRLGVASHHAKQRGGDEDRHEDHAEQAHGDAHPLADLVGLGEFGAQHRASHGGRSGTQLGVDLGALLPRKAHDVGQVVQLR